MTRDETTLLHTADWQLGKPFGRVRDEAARERLTTLRYDALRRIADLANERRVAAVVVAGDVFDDAHPGHDTLQRAAEALRELRAPLLLLPGNHDAAAPGDDEGALHRFAREREALRSASPTVVLDEERPYDEVVEGVVFWPAPVRPEQQGDPTNWIHGAAPDDDGRLHVLVAHGGDRTMLQALQGGGTHDEKEPNIDVGRFFAEGVRSVFAYGALGDWHSPLEVPGTAGRARYAGTPEQCSWKERDPGHVLLVTLPAARVEQVRVGEGRWVRLPADGTSAFAVHTEEDLERLERWVQQQQPLSKAWLRLTLAGRPSVGLHRRLRAWLQELARRTLQLEVDDDRLRPAIDEGWLEQLADDPVVGAVAGALREALEAHAEDTEAPETVPEPDDVEAFEKWVEDGDLDRLAAPREAEVLRLALTKLADAWQEKEGGAR